MIILREIREEDAEDMLDWMHDPEGQKGFRKNLLGVTLEEAREFCRNAKLTEEPEQGQSIHLAVAGDGDEYLGTISLKEVNLEYHSAELAIALRKKARGQGIAAEAVELLLKKAFGEMKLHRVYLTVLADNITAIRLYEKCGFIFEGELRDHLFLNGRYISWKLYGILENEFAERMQRRKIGSQAIEEKRN